MKYTGLILLLLTFLSSSVQAQDCTFYFPKKVGSVLEITQYDKKGKIQNIVLHKVKSNNSTAERSEVIVEYEFHGKEVDDQFETSGEYKVFCENGAYKFEFGALIPSSNAMGNGDMEMEMKSDFLEIPNNPQPGQTMPDGKLEMTAKIEGNPLMGKGFQMTVYVTGRKVEALEKITTPAGTFDCVKISSVSESKIMMIKTKTRTVEWFADGVGLVRSEYYDKRDKLDGYSELTRLEK